tara:strand:+ start:55 stop:954 length:900 start_codon:yes stop_codon:yes gene_type:complete
MSNETQQKVKFHIYENFFSQAYLDLLSLEVIGKEYLKPEQNRLQIALASSSESIENSLSFETENGRVFGNFYDKNNCFNVNSLVSKINNSQDRVSRINSQLLKNLGMSLEIPEYDMDIIVSSLIDWIDTNSTPQDTLGAEDINYTAKKNPYLPTNQLIVDLPEIRNINGMNDEIYKQLKPYLCVHPSRELNININALSPKYPHLIIAITENQLDFYSAQNVLLSKPYGGYKSTKEFFDMPEFDGLALSGSIRESLSTQSNYYEIDVEITNGSNTYDLISKIEITSTGPKVYMRKIGKYL